MSTGILPSPRGVPLPRGPPPRVPAAYATPQQISRNGSINSGGSVPMPRGPPPRGPPPRGPPLRGAPSGIRGPPPRGPSPRHIMMSRGPPPRGGPPRGPPFASMPGRGGPPRGPPGPWAANGLGPRPNSLVINQSRRASYAGPSTVAAMATSVRSHESTKTVPGNIVQSHPPSTFPSYKPNISNKSIAPLGVLTIRCVKAIDLASSNDSSIFTKADPYVKLTIGETVFLTKTKVRAGADPVWNEEFKHDIIGEKEVKVEVFDKEMVSEDKLMGKATISILDWIATGSFNGTIDLLDDSGKLVGKIELAASFKREVDTADEITDSYQNQSNAPQQFTDEQILEAFRAFDLDKNNFVGAAEIRHVLVNIGERVTDEEIDEMIRMVDKDGDGQVGFDEFYNMVTGNKPPPGLGSRGSMRSILSPSGTPTPPIGPAIIQARNAKRKALDEFARDNNLKPESIKRAYRRFMVSDKNKSGVIDYTEFCVILQVDPSTECEELFQLYDYDDIGMIDARELLVALANFTGAGKDDKLKFSFMVYDEEGNGVITKEELIQILKANHMAKVEGEVTRKAETIMAQADKKGDGVITYDEFVIVSKKFPNILFPAQRQSMVN